MASNENGSEKTKRARTSGLIHFFRTPGFSEPTLARLMSSAKEIIPSLTALDTEFCFNIELIENEHLNERQSEILQWLLAETFEQEGTGSTSFLTAKAATVEASEEIIEVGPRLNFSTAWSSNAVSICEACGLPVTRLERSRRYLLQTSSPLTPAEKSKFLDMVHDKMTEMPYQFQLDSFESGVTPEPVQVVPVLEEGRAALEKINKEEGLGFDDWDLDYYTNLFKEKLGRDPTDVELFDMGQANSEHSRHWFFGGKMVIDGTESKQTLFQMVKATLPAENNSVIAFHDNSSAIQGAVIKTLMPETPGAPCALTEKNPLMHPILTAETHNFPSGVAPFPGAETGTGGRLRDVTATGKGAAPIGGISSYCVGNLRIPGYEQPWEPDVPNAPNLASPLQIEIEASNGASDYGNKFGEPVVAGFTRAFGQRLPNGERFEYLKPIMFSAGIGQMSDLHKAKDDPEVGMWVVKIGGPAYRIGMGGGAASSILSGDNDAALDFNAVQRGDAEMENKMNRLMRACIEMGEANPIVSVHDQGAGGNGNVLKEIVDPLGARYELRDIKAGDKTLSVKELWGAEYQENNGLLVKEENKALLERMAAREKCPVSFVGQVTDDGRVVVHDRNNGTTPFDLPLSLVLGKMPQKTFNLDHMPFQTTPLDIPADVTVEAALDRVLRLVSVGSKRFLTNKVDRSVTGLIAQQQCVGPLQTPLSNCAVLAQSHFSKTGIATAVGEQPIKGLVCPEAMARITVAECVTNLMWAKVTALQDIKCSANWMWAAKLPGEGAKLYDACKAMSEAMITLGIGIDGGKDSLSMAAKVGDETVKSPGTLTITAYVGVTDISKTVTPDMKKPGNSRLLLVDLGAGNYRLGGTSLAQVYSQVGDQSPDLADMASLKNTFEAVQDLIEDGLIVSGHDRSDGGLIVTLCEMALSGNCGLNVNIPKGSAESSIALLFSEEAGIVLEVEIDKVEVVTSVFKTKGVPCVEIGESTIDKTIKIQVDGEIVLESPTASIRDTWEATSFQLERLQCNPGCVAQEEAMMANAKGPNYELTFTPMATAEDVMNSTTKPKVAVLRQEGSNGDREMISAFYSAGFEVWDLTVEDLLQGTITLEAFQGIVFVGGFSYADVLDAGKGWAGVIKFNPGVFAQFQAFKERPDTFSLGVCNGCQLMALLGWIPKHTGLSEMEQPRFVENTSGRFESRFSTVKITKSPAIMLQGMEGSSLGVWVAHHEGHCHFPSKTIHEWVVENDLAPMVYVDEDNNPTEAYPFNPNGSVGGITALCSEDGRHLAMMPHPERCFKVWQWPYLPEKLQSLEEGPWLQMFQNARIFCEHSRSC
mmetsp:Transcript_19003/g.23950  ORF Transcript_19003/g.23950 Transcript_19003/m.23950 type:complete len:1327 (-) Transcript_19003:412-4392(-)